MVSQFHHFLTFDLDWIDCCRRRKFILLLQNLSFRATYHVVTYPAIRTPFSSAFTFTTHSNMTTGFKFDVSWIITQNTLYHLFLFLPPLLFLSYNREDVIQLEELSDLVSPAIPLLHRSIHAGGVNKVRCV